jgi:hypothetical protein
LATLARTCPEAQPAASVVGDPCYDVLLASSRQRTAYRRALHVADSHKLLVVASTWGTHSLFGHAESVLPRLLAELPRETYQVAALLHPNIWYGHGTWQVRAWLADCLRSGLRLIPPDADWRAALTAADAIITDHGSLGVYGTVVKVPLMLAGFPGCDVDPGSPSALLADAAPRLCPGRSLHRQLAHAAATHSPRRYEAVTARITSQPGRFDRNMRRLIYRLLRLRQPATIPAAHTAEPPFLFE